MRVAAFALACAILCACGAEEPVTDADKAMFLRANDLARFGYHFDNVEQLETFSKKRQLDGAYEVTYRFKTVDGAPKVLFLHVSVKVGTSEADASLNQGAEKLGLLIGFKKSGVEERALPDTPAGKLSLLVKEERPIGNVYTAVHGAKTYLLVMSGLYFDDPALWHKVIAPKMELFQSYSPQGKI
jgi:hypothetical protein